MGDLFFDQHLCRTADREHRRPYAGIDRGWKGDVCSHPVAGRAFITPGLQPVAVADLARFDLDRRRSGIGKFKHQLRVAPCQSTQIDQLATVGSYSPSMSRRAWSGIIAAAIGFGTGGIATSAALAEGIEPFAVVAIRALLGAGVIYAALIIRKRPLTRERRVYRLGFTIGISQLALPFVFFTIAYLYASVGFIGLFASLIPLGTAVMAHRFVPGEHLTPMTVAGLTLALVGVTVVVSSGDSGLTQGGRPLLAAGLAVLGVLAISAGSIVAKREAGSYSLVEMAAIQHLLGGFILTGLMLVVEGLPDDISLRGWLFLGYLAVFGSAVPFIIFFWLLETVSVSKASLVGYLVPIVGLVGGIVLLDEELQAGIVLGGLLILGGVVWTDRSQHAAEIREAGGRGRAVPRKPG